MLLLTILYLVTLASDSDATNHHADDTHTEVGGREQKEVACKSYSRLIAPKIAQNINGQGEEGNKKQFYKIKYCR